jgi:1-acyl-sn-glycerol-3-phosphate acyltransferase
MYPPAPGRTPFHRTVLRRLITIPFFFAVAVAYLALSPVLLAAALAIDLALGTRFSYSRTATMAGAYLVLEVCGTLGGAGAWVLWHLAPRATAADFMRWSFRLEEWYLGSLYRSLERIFGMRTVIEGADLVRPGPVMIFARHVSTADTFLPVVALYRPPGFTVRFVMKAELLWVPCFDVLGGRLPNCYVTRGTGDRGRQVGLMQELLTGLGPDEGLVIFPEGTRSTPEKRRSILERARREGDEELARRVLALDHLLPMRTAGPLGLLARDGTSDVVLLGHVGLEGGGSLFELVRGTLVGSTVRVRFWRYPRAQVPSDPVACAAWLDERWGDMDRWIADQLASPAMADARPLRQVA